MDFDSRCKISEQILRKYPDRVPVIIRTDFPKEVILHKTKFLAPRDMSLGHIYAEVRGHLTGVTPETALFLVLSGNYAPTISMDMQSLYDRYKDKDGFLYFTACLENTFG